MKIFVYGTLKEGGKLHGNMKAINAQLLNTDIALKGYAMYDMGWYPAIVEDESSIVIGEVYIIQSHLLKHLDSVEGYPSLYQRKETDIGTIYYMEDLSRIEGKEKIESGIWNINK